MASLKCVCGQEFKSLGRKRGHTMGCKQWHDCITMIAAEKHVHGKVQELATAYGIAPTVVYGYIKRQNTKIPAVPKAKSVLEATPEQIIGAIEGLIARLRELESKDCQLVEAKLKIKDLQNELDRNRKRTIQLISTEIEANNILQSRQ